MDITSIKASVDALTAKTNAAIESMERGLKVADQQISDIESSLNRVLGAYGTSEPYNAFGPANGGEASPQSLKAELKAIAALVVSGDKGPLSEIHAAMSVGSDPDGGYLVLPAVSSTMTQKMFDGVTMRRLARVETMEAGSEWIEPIDSEEAEGDWIGESESRPETDTPQLKMLKIPLDELYALPKLTQKLLDDSQWNIGAWIVRKITDTFIRKENVAFINGNGVGKPRGLLTYDTATTADASRDWGVLQHVVSGSATDITADALRNLYWTVRAPHRRNATWLMSSATANSIDNLKDGNGRPLWRDSLESGARPTLLGRPVEFEENMPAVASNALPIAFGDFNDAYTIVDRPGVKMLRDEYTSKGQVKFYSHKRVGGRLANSEAVKLMKIST